jgi:hypothetical protein
LIRLGEEVDDVAGNHQVDILLCRSVVVHPGQKIREQGAVARLLDHERAVKMG